MDMFQVPRREAEARILLDDGRTLEGQLFLATAGPDGRPETVWERLNMSKEQFDKMPDHWRLAQAYEDPAHVVEDRQTRRLAAKKAREAAQHQGEG